MVLLFIKYKYTIVNQLTVRRNTVREVDIGVREITPFHSSIEIGNDNRLT